ncbi:MAG: TrmB family transcriptional regulator [Acidobacteria bacterium]|nr:TrmB family transcriptional regulator [Acidobacteriota bacterium]
MSREIPGSQFERLWRRLQQLGLNAYEARSYLVLLGHSRFKALELAARASVPRQKIYEVLDSLLEKGFTQVVQEKTKLFSAVEPELAIPAYVTRRQAELETEISQQAQLAESIKTDLREAYSDSQGGRGTLDYLRIVSDPSQTAAQYRRMLADVRREYIEFSRPPYAVDPLDEELVRQARERGVACRILIERSVEMDHQRLAGQITSGVEVRYAHALPMKLAVFDGRQGMIALLDPVTTKPAWTAIVFDHAGMGEAMRGLFEGHWNRASDDDHGAGI